MIFSKAVCIFAAALFVAPAAFALGTPDGQPPAIEQVCSHLKGAAFGLCNAYCEAQDCDMHMRPSCEILRANFEKLTGSPILPCDSVVTPDCTVIEDSDSGPVCGGACASGGVCVTFGTECGCTGGGGG